MRLTTFKVEKSINNRLVVLYPTLIQTGGRNYLVDCGYEETAEEFIRELKALGVEIRELRGVIITHDDHDHLGGLVEFKRQNPDLMVYCGELEKDSVSGKIKSERLLQAENMLEKLPEEQKPWATDFIKKLKSVRRFIVDNTFEDMAVFENEIIIVHTPGHTEGHISLYHTKDKTLIAGDAIVVENGELSLANPNFTLHIEAAIKSVEKIRDLNPEKLICYHGGVVDDNVDQRLESLITRYKNNSLSF